MPRTTPQQQFERYQFIQRVFVEDRSMFADLLALNQWALFGFYKPKSDFTLEQLRGYQAAMAKQEPSLPQRAGRAYREFERAYAARQARAKLPRIPIVKDRRNSRTRNRNYVVRGLVRDEIDGPKLARVLIEIARQQVENARHDDAA